MPKAVALYRYPVKGFTPEPVKQITAALPAHPNVRLWYERLAE